MITLAQFRNACGAFPTGVSIVARWHEGERHGVTVSSFTSVSLEPPLVLVCIRAESTFLRGLTLGDAVYVNVLAADQSDVSDRFARMPPPDRFIMNQWEGLELKEALAVLECRTHGRHRVGDHEILILAVQDSTISSRDPLVWCGSRYRLLQNRNAGEERGRG